MSFTATINDDNYHFVAEEGTNDSWEIKEIGDDRTQQPETPEQPQQPGETGGTPTLTASTTTPLTEATLDESIVTLTLSGGTYESSSSRIRNAVTVSTGITGVTVRSFDIDRVSDTEVTVELTFDGTNFDTNSTITFTVGAGAIAEYDGDSTHITSSCHGKHGIRGRINCLAIDRGHTRWKCRYTHAQWQDLRVIRCQN